MRNGQNKRMRGRNRGKGQNPLTRVYESNGPDIKIRGTASHVAEKYMALARDAQAYPPRDQNYGGRQPNQQLRGDNDSNIDRLPSFITGGGQPQGSGYQA